MNNFTKSKKTGLILMLIAVIIMVSLTVVGEQIPTLFVALFVIGMVMSIVSELFARGKQK